MAEPSNLIGPGPSTGFCSLLAGHIVRSETAAAAGEAAPAAFRLSSRQAKRDFLDVRDAVRAYGCILDSGETGRIYRIDSGTERGLGEIAEKLLAHAAVPVPIDWGPEPAEADRGMALRHLPFRRSHLLNLLVEKQRLTAPQALLLFQAGGPESGWTSHWRILSATQGPARKEECDEAQSLRSDSLL